MSPAQVKISGNKVYVKRTGSITTLLTSVASKNIHPGKGSHNPPRIETPAKIIKPGG